MIALKLALTFQQLCWPNDEERYLELRTEAQQLISMLGLVDIVVPEHQDELTANVRAVTTPVTAHLQIQEACASIAAARLL